jgi:hypothetical protein
MALALLGYFGSMVAAFAVLMTLLNIFFAYSPLERTRPQPHPLPVIAQTAAPEENLSARGPPVVHGAADISVAKNTEDTSVAKNTEEVRTADAVRADAEKSKRLKLARLRKRQMLARQREQVQAPTVLGYAQEPSYGQAWSPFAARRF